ncbi:MAG: hypothetical protein ABW040_08085 [Microbacteriaceae bacterium]
MHQLPTDAGSVEWLGQPDSWVRGKWRRAGIFAAVALVVAGLIAVGIVMFAPGTRTQMYAIYPVVLAAFAASIFTVVEMSPAPTSVLRLAGIDRDRRRPIRRAVARADLATLPADEVPVARALATATARYVPLQVFQMGTLYLGLLANVLVLASLGSSDSLVVLNRVVAGTLIAVAAVGFPYMLARAARAKRVAALAE